MEQNLEKDSNNESKKLNDDLIVFMRKRSESDLPGYGNRLKNYVDLQKKRRRAAAARRHIVYNRPHSSHKIESDKDPSKKENNENQQRNDPDSKGPSDIDKKLASIFRPGKGVRRKKRARAGSEEKTAPTESPSGVKGHGNSGDNDNDGGIRSRSRSEPSDRCCPRRRRRDGIRKEMFWYDSSYESEDRPACRKRKRRRRRRCQCCNKTESEDFLDHICRRLDYMQKCGCRRRRRSRCRRRRRSRCRRRRRRSRCRRRRRSRCRRRRRRSRCRRRRRRSCRRRRRRC